MLVNGIDLGSLGAQLEPQDTGMILLLDGDFLIYQAAATVKTLPTAIRRFYTLVMTEMFLTGCKTCRVFITPTGSAKCNRYLYPSVLPYQGQRKNRAELPLKQPLKQHLIRNQVEYADKCIEIICDDWNEADDLLIQHSYELKERGLLSSGDKDLRLTPYPWWDAEMGRIEPTLDPEFGYLYWDPDANMPCKGRGRKFFWAQMLMGDQADNVRGILKYQGKPCGPATAYRLLHEVQTEEEAANLVVSAYAEINQDVLAEAQMLWLRRTQDDCAYKYLMEVLTAEPLIEWVKQLHQYHQAHIKYVQEQSEYGEADL